MGVLAVVIGRGHGRNMGGCAVVNADAQVHREIGSYLKDIAYDVFLDRIYLNYPSSSICLFGQKSNP